MLIALLVSDLFETDQRGLMVQLLRFIAAFVRWCRRLPAEREAEIVFVRQQLIILKWTVREVALRK